MFELNLNSLFYEGPVILWGRGRGGSLAIWARQKYPNVIDGAWGSSATLNIVVDLDYFPNVFSTITQIGGNECGQVITDAFRMIEEAFESGNTSYVEQRLMTCGAFDVGNGFDLALFTFLTAINVASFVSSSKYSDIEAKCRIMRGLNNPLNPPSDPLDAFARWYIDDFHLGLGTSCNPVSNEENIKLYQDPSWSGNSTISTRRQRFWQTCTQFAQWRIGYYGEGHPFGTRFNTNFMQQWCAGAFENELLLDPYWAVDTFRSLNKMFGGLNPGAYRLFLTQGEMDASRSLGPSSDINSLSPVVVIPLQSFGRDLYAPDASRDSFVLYQTKLRIQQTVQEWINYARYGENSTAPTI